MCQNLYSIENLATHVECLKVKNLSALRTLPAQTGELSNLDTLVVSNCQHNLVELLAAITTLKKHLDVSHCGGLEGLPVEIGHLSNLRTLRIGSCRNIKSIPESLQSLTTLQDLKILWGAELTSIPADLDQLPKLDTIDLTYCYRDAVFGLFDSKWKEDCPLIGGLKNCICFFVTSHLYCNDFLFLPCGRNSIRMAKG
jgi:Leucine-rich repeat (LRR) protein